MLAKNAKKEVHVCNNETVKWEHEGKLYILHIQQDVDCGSPREDDNIDIMACFHPRYNFGDDLKFKTPSEFWQWLVRENVPKSEIASAAEDGKLDGIRIANHDDGERTGLVDVYETVGQSEPSEYLEYEGIPKDAVAEYLMDDLTVGQCMTLMEPYSEWMPLWLYDHSGQSISCGERVYPYNDAWDSSQVGWIVALKYTIMTETWAYELDKHGEKVLELRTSQDGSTYLAWKIKPLTEDTWRKQAREIMSDNVKLYDQYLRGDVYGYTLYEAVPEHGESFWDPDFNSKSLEWDEIDSCWGFYGTDILSNGITDMISCYGCEDAIENETYLFGTVKFRMIPTIEFD